MLMKTAQQIRLSNFHLLLAEAKSQVELARRSGVAQPFVNQLAKGTTHPDGTPRAIGDETARKLEKGMDKPNGWMDRDHTLAMLFSELDGLEGQLVTLYRKLDEEGRNALLAHANDLFSKANPEPSHANPYPKVRKTAKH